MEWLYNPVPNNWQWIGLFATILGLAATFGAAVWAALRAKGAEKQSKQARDAAIRLGNVLHLSDLLEDMQELQAMLAREDFDGLAAKAGTIRGRIERFGRQQALYGLSTDETAQALDMAKGHLDVIMRAAAQWTGKPENRPGRIRIAVANAYQALTKAFANHHASLDDRVLKP
jgi:hypothetical protein